MSIVKSFSKIIITMIIDIFKGLFIKGPIIKPVDMNETVIMSQSELQKQINSIPQPEEKKIMLVTVDQFVKIFPHGNVSIIDSINKILPIHDIATHERVAAFLAQCGHESSGFTRLVENLNYRAEPLMKTFPSRFSTIEEAQKFEHKPEAIANHVYSGKLGNGDEASGDGWKFRGHGALQTTGRTAHEVFAKFIGKSLEETLVYITTNDGAIESAAFYWVTNKCNVPSDIKDMVRLTEIINGRAKLGLAERTTLFNIAYPIIADNFKVVV